MHGRLVSGDDAQLMNALLSSFPGHKVNHWSNFMVLCIVTPNLFSRLWVSAWTSVIADAV